MGGGDIRQSMFLSFKVHLVILNRRNENVEAIDVDCPSNFNEVK